MYSGIRLFLPVHLPDEVSHLSSLEHAIASCACLELEVRNVEGVLVVRVSSGCIAFAAHAARPAIPLIIDHNVLVHQTSSSLIMFPQREHHHSRMPTPNLMSRSFHRIRLWHVLHIRPSLRPCSSSSTVARSSWNSAPTC